MLGNHTTFRSTIRREICPTDIRVEVIYVTDYDATSLVPNLHAAKFLAALNVQPGLGRVFAGPVLCVLCLMVEN